MYQNKVTLIGFLGSNPEGRTNSPDFSVTTLSLATKSSYKKDGKYISHTEWHRCVVFGKLSEFALYLDVRPLLEGAGELRKLSENDATVPFGVRDVFAVFLVGRLGCQRECGEAAIVVGANF